MVVIEREIQNTKVGEKHSLREWGMPNHSMYYLSSDHKFGGAGQFKIQTNFHVFFLFPFSFLIDNSFVRKGLWPKPLGPPHSTSGLFCLI